ncbi:hypothetical protein [Streptomyces flavidovirens]|uniref:hypothetical protein n=1 Tax=Streptomyces flavidovirens TaxID=67298 RepID=UPI0004251907|nr:hypothetical protein [Streptomyces flavidovirens]
MTPVDYVYRVDAPAGSAGWRPLGARYRGTITTATQPEDAEFVAAVVVRDLATEWDHEGSGVHHVRICVWRDIEGVGPEDAECTVEVQPDLDTLPGA